MARPTPTERGTRPDAARPGMTGAWAASVVLAAVFVPLGLIKLSGALGTRDMFASWGLGLVFLYGVGLWELLAGMLVLVPRLASYAGAMLTLEMVGAALVHVANGEWVLLFAPFLMGAVALYVAWAWLPLAGGTAARVRPIGDR